MRLSELFRERRRQLAQAVGLTEHQWAVLEEVAGEHFMPSMFAKTQQSSAAAVSKTLRQLMDKQLIRSSIDPDDGRQRRYELTKRGNDVLVSLRANREHAITAVWLRLGRAEVRAFTEFGTDLIRRLEEYATAADKE